MTRAVLPRPARVFFVSMMDAGEGLHGEGLPMQARSAAVIADAYQIQCHQAWCTTFVAGGFLVSSAALFAITAGVRPCGWVDAWVRCARCALFVACAVPAPRVPATSVLPCAAAPMARCRP